MTDWLLENLIPANTFVAILDESDDVAPQAAIDAGVDCVIFLHSQDPGTLSGRPFMVEIAWKSGLVPGHRGPAPFWMRWDGSGFVRVEERAA